MMEAMRARFLPRFVATANERLERCLQRASAEPADLETVRRELHALAGEASMLGFTDIQQSSRQGEETAREWAEEPTPQAVVRCVRVLRTLSRQVRSLQATAASAAPPPSATEGERLVLIVEDSAITADRLSEALRDAGFGTAVAEDLGAALRLVRERTPAIVVADAHLPDAEGAQVCERLRPHVAGARIIVCSGLEGTELEALARAAGADGHVSKSGGVDAIVAAVRRASDRGKHGDHLEDIH